jgi:hypothetical protein
MSIEKVLWFGLGFALGYYGVAHFRKTGKVV